jgi:hypothetical protein
MPMADCKNVHRTYGDSEKKYALEQWSNFIDQDNQNGNNLAYICFCSDLISKEGPLAASSTVISGKVNGSKVE